MKFLYTLSFLFLVLSAINAQNLPIIHATSSVMDIKEGTVLNKGAWSIMPEYKPDVFTSSSIGEEVTFYTDIDSITVTIHQDSVYNFIVLLNGVDSAYTQIRYKPTYLEILKGAEVFDDNDKTEVPKFTYQDSSAAPLRALREGFKLDSIAGGGDEVSRILNLLHWIHDIVPHDGQNANPVVKNAMSMLKECKRDERGLNCRGLSIVLNECYLALGFKSTYITCMPKDSVFQDCHVINMVYSNDLDKWLWIDPTNDAYVMDENGILLSVAEVRERVINGKTVIVNPDANWNHRASVKKEYYLMEYMAKNMYRFEIPLRSEYNYETAAKDKRISYVELLPLDAYQQHPKHNVYVAKKSGVIWETYKTNNTKVFWQEE